ncbi:MAG: sodium:calcium antiporter [Rhodospirillales bacterium]|nr:MAG: sodium:calcium antiporter [Rhodospirillales bacterium]
MIPFPLLSLLENSLLFLAAGAVITLAGVKLTALADRLADVTRLGEAITGALLLGASTSLAGIVVSVTAAGSGHAEMAVSNAVGGIAAQTFFIALADFTYRRANLEHAAASYANLVHGTTLMALLCLPLLAHAAPAVDVFGVHPVTPVLVVAYLGGLRLASYARDEPMWRPKQTVETREDVPAELPGTIGSVVALGGRYGVLAIIVAGAGFVVARTGLAIADETGLDAGLIGAVLTGVVTSAPELVTTLAAVRRGALTLAVGGILGGNAFDVLFLALADTAYRPGSIYHAMTGAQVFLIVLAMLMTTALLLGLLRRETHGIANVGFESALIMALYAGGLVILILAW